MSELNREQIIKALECCSDCDCYNAKMQEDCPLINVPFCKNYLRKQSLNLINEFIEDNKAKDKTITNLIETIKGIQADTVRKMQERLLSVCYRYPHAVGVDGINQIAKEMLEETES